MDPLTDPVAIAFCNEKLRPTADRAAGFFLRCQAVLLEWQFVQASIPNDATPIEDGAPADGRRALTGADIWTFMGGLQLYVQQIQANTDALLNNAVKISVNPQNFA